MIWGLFVPVSISLAGGLAMVKFKIPKEGGRILLESQREQIESL